MQKTLTLLQIQYIDKIVGVAVAIQRQVPTAAVRRTTDACDSDVQKDDPWSSHRPSTLKGTGTSRLRYNINTLSSTARTLPARRRRMRRNASRRLCRTDQGGTRKASGPRLLPTRLRRSSLKCQRSQHGNFGVNTSRISLKPSADDAEPRSDEPNTRDRCVKSISEATGSRVVYTTGQFSSDVFQ